MSELGLWGCSTSAAPTRIDDCENISTEYLRHESFLLSTNPGVASPSLACPLPPTPVKSDIGHKFAYLGCRQAQVKRPLDPGAGRFVRLVPTSEDALPSTDALSPAIILPSISDVAIYSAITDSIQCYNMKTCQRSSNPTSEWQWSPEGLLCQLCIIGLAPSVTAIEFCKAGASRSLVLSPIWFRLSLGAG